MNERRIGAPIGASGEWYSGSVPDLAPLNTLCVLQLAADERGATRAQISADLSRLLLEDRSLYEALRPSSYISGQFRSALISVRRSAAISGQFGSAFISG
jgi:hypothetical protein